MYPEIARTTAITYMAGEKFDCVRGDQYYGSHNVATTKQGRSVKCKQWSALRFVFIKQENQKWISAIPYFRQNHQFRALTENFCRNPDNDPKGPWCYHQIYPKGRFFDFYSIKFQKLIFFTEFFKTRESLNLATVIFQNVKN